MFLRWIHSIWKYFWRTLLVILLLLLVLSGGLLGVLQLNTSKDFLAREIEQRFNNELRGDLNIGNLDGFLPFRFELNDVVLTTDSSRKDSVLTISHLQTQIDVWSLLQKKLSIVDFKVENPRLRMLADGKGGYTLNKAFTPVTPSEDRDLAQNEWIREIEIIAPVVSIQNGSFYVEKFYGGGENMHFPEPFRVESINTAMFLEVSRIQRFLDIEHFSAELPGLNVYTLELSGQIYNDNRFLEFNAFNISTPRSAVTVSGQIDGVNLETGKLMDQLPEADYNLEVKSDHIHLSEFNDLLPQIPNISQPLDLSIQADGDADSLSVNEFVIGSGESFLSIDGAVKKLMSRKDLNYEFRVNNVYLLRNDLQKFADSLRGGLYGELGELRVEGRAGGTVDSLNVDLDIRTPQSGTFGLEAFAHLKDPFRYNGSVNALNVDLGAFANQRIDSTDINLNADFNGYGFNPKKGLHNFTVLAFNSLVGDVYVDNMEITASMVDGFVEHQHVFESGGDRISGSGWLDLNQEELPFAMKGEATGIDLSRYFSKVPSSDVNFDYNIEVQGLHPDRIHGRANLDVKPSMIGQDTVKAHQFYMDLDAPDSGTRTFRLTSSMFDVSLTGSIKPTLIVDQVDFWKRYIRDRVNEEIFLQAVRSEQRDTTKADLDPMALSGTIETKDLTLIRHYVPSLPRVVSASRFNFDIKADSSRLLVTADGKIDSAAFNTIATGNAVARLTASFNADAKLKEFGSLDFETTMDTLSTDFVDLDSLFFDVSLKQDSLFITQNIGRVSEDARSRLQLTSHLSGSSIEVKVNEFFLGNDRYAWTNETTPVLYFNRRDEVQFENFRFNNQNEFLEIRGRLSGNPQDSLLLVLQDVNLERISDLINGRLSFNGTMNGMLTSRSLLSEPTLQGELNVTRLTIDDRLVGDATFQSRFNPDLNRFDTRLSIVTDSTKYSEYLSENDDIGQRIILDGYVVPPNNDAKQDTVFYFDTKFKEIDLWILTGIANKVFEEVEGRATGEGYLTGNFEDYDFHVDFQVENAYAKPQFFNTNYFVNGHVVFDRHNWLVLDSLQVTDTKGGRGIVYGDVDLNNFQPINNMNIFIRMQDLQFLNNTYDPDVPFYGSLSGAGLVHLTGPNTNMFLRTIEPIQVTSDSRLSIPLLEETELDESTTFIQFVDEFNPRARKTASILERVREQETERDVLNQMIENLTFTERFNLDLQFNANNPMIVELIFDQVTGDIVTAQGTGQLRLTMAEEEVQMFGRYNITSGTYNFVGGEIITRRLDLERGGTIIWEGDPDNARLDIQAIYDSRPNINVLTSGASATDPTGDDEQRVPIELVVEITGTITSVENNYYFRLPSTLDVSSSNTALTARINELNRDDQEKLIQATSILLTGEFITYSDANQAGLNIGQSFTRSSTYINPLISSQVISPLLSNQINALLNSDVSRLDIDFSLNAYNEIDLGVALRLYNDRLILRREGLLTTSSSSEATLSERIGDLNATYRINRGLSVTAFHRQDQTLSNVTSGTQTSNVAATVDGIGLEAQVKFNTWKDFTRKIKNTFLGIFGGKKDEKEETGKLASDGSDEENNEEN